VEQARLEDAPMNGPRTLAIDVGGSGLKAIVLSPAGDTLSERIRRETPYPCTPPVLLDELTALAATQPAHDRVSVGFPGAVRRGRVHGAPPAFSRPGPGLPADPELAALWTGYDLEAALAERFGKPTRAANDADVQGCAVISGHGMELVITLGTGVGCAVFFDGVLLPHMELSHGTFGGTSIEVACGDNSRKQIGKDAWRARVLEALDAFEAMVLPDHLYIGGGNAKKLDPEELGPNRSLVPNISGLLGGIALWERTNDTPVPATLAS
jgi:polyphosphate glucokinase